MERTKQNKRVMGKCLTRVTLWFLFGRYLSLVLLILNEFFEAVKCPSGYHGLQRKRCLAFLKDQRSGTAAEQRFLWISFQEKLWGSESQDASRGQVKV